MISVALVGPDGAGKTAVARRVIQTLPGPTAYLYLGTNPDMDAPRLPTTRLAARARPPRPTWPPLRTAKSWCRTFAWLAEELYRGRQATRLQRRALVVRDRDFLADRLAGPEPRRAHGRFHRAVLRRLFPAPDLTVVLDVPAEVLFARKGELTPEELDRRRRGYLALGTALPRVVVVDGTRPLDEVVGQVVDLTLATLAEQHAGSPVTGLVRS